MTLFPFPDRNIDTQQLEAYAFNGRIHSISFPIFYSMLFLSYSFGEESVAQKKLSDI